MVGLQESYKLYTDYEVNPTSNSVSYVEISGSNSNVEIFSQKMLAITVRVKTNSIFAELSTDGINYGKKIQLDADELTEGDTLSVSFECKSIRLTNVNNSGIANGKYQVIGWK